MKSIPSTFALALFMFSVSTTGFAQTPIQSAGTEIRINPLVVGTLLLPSEENPPLAIIVPGSGPTDRNGNQQMMQNNSLKKLAEGLTANGIATFRYDKRIIPLIMTGKMVEEKMTVDDFVEDAVSATRYFTDKGYSNITLIGHSQGALVAVLAAKKVKVEKLVSLAGAGRTIDAIIVDQLTFQAPGLTENAKEAFADLRESGKAENFSPGLMSIFRPSVQPFMSNWMRYDPAKEIKDLDLTILIITGSKDLQVPNTEGEILAKAKPEATYRHIEGMNHVLKYIDGDDLVNQKSYNLSSLPIIPELITVITDFVKK